MLSIEYLTLSGLLLESLTPVTPDDVLKVLNTRTGNAIFATCTGNGVEGGRYFTPQSNPSDLARER